MTGTPCAPVHDVLPPMLAAGYAVQQVLSARALEGGAGKTTTATHLARAYQLDGLNTTLIDSDPEG